MSKQRGGEKICNASSCPAKSAKRVFALDVPGIHVLFRQVWQRKTWMAGSSPAMTGVGRIQNVDDRRNSVALNP
jgi:hypothetical protein